MEEYAGNSHKQREKAALATNQQTKTVKKVISGSAKVKKQNDIQKFRNELISDQAKNLKSFILMDVILPWVKQGLYDVVVSGIGMTLGINDPNRVKRRTPSGQRVIYPSNSYSTDYTNYSRNSQPAYTQQNGDDWDSIEYTSRADVDAVLGGMNGIIEEYGLVSVADLYDLSDIPTTNYALNDIGWKDLQGARIVRLNNGNFVLKLPKARTLK